MKKTLYLMTFLAVVAMAMSACKTAQPPAKSGVKPDAPLSTDVAGDTKIIPLGFDNPIMEYNLGVPELKRIQVLNSAQIILNLDVDSKAQKIDDEGTLILSKDKNLKKVVIDANTKGIIDSVDKKKTTFYVRFDKDGYHATLPFVFGGQGGYYYFNLNGTANNDGTMTLNYNNEKYKASLAYKTVYLLCRIKEPVVFKKEEKKASGISPNEKSDN